MQKLRYTQSWLKAFSWLGGFLVMALMPVTSSALENDAPAAESLPLIDPHHIVSETVLETFLSPGEFSNRRFVHTIRGDEAVFSLDAGLSAEKPFATLHAERVRWPDIAGLPLEIEGNSYTLQRSSDTVDDDALDRGFFVRWTLKPLGQRFSPTPHFAALVVEVEVVSPDTGARLLFWRAEESPPTCTTQPPKGRPNCELESIGLEAQAISLSPSGKLLSLAFGGLRPRLEVYNVEREPRLIWQAVFSKASGGVVTSAFSSDEKWVVALTGQGRMHRFDAATGGRHLGIPSSGRTASAVTEKRIMAVAGGSGEVQFWYLDDGTIAWQLPPRRDKGPVDRLAASGDGTRFATLEYNEKNTVLRVWEWKNRAVVAQFEAEPYAIYDIALDETGEVLYWSHEERGLFAVKVKKGAVPKPVKGKGASRCRERLQWISGDNSLSCSVSKGELRIDPAGRLKRQLIAADSASEWIISASPSGTRLAAVGGGHLLVWWAR
jgi:hypothetical protein